MHDVQLATSGQTTKLPVDKLQIVKLATSGQTTIFRDAVLTYKCINNLNALDYLCNKFRKSSSIHKRQTRRQDSLQIPLFKTPAGQRSFAY